MGNLIRVLTAAAVSMALALPAAAAPAAARLPGSIAALGDSITRGFNACGFYVDCTRRSWSTGDDEYVNSHRLRLRAAAQAPLRQENLARRGAAANDLARQATRAVEFGADYVTVLIGANDACRSRAAQMTPVAEFRERIDAGLQVLRRGLPRARVFVASIPDLYRLWRVGHERWHVRYVWEKLDVCQALLDDAGSDDPADVARRQAVRDRVRAYNDALAAACAGYGPRCRFDGYAVFETEFTLGQLTRWDYFHPDKSGQRLLARVSWEAGFFS